jgi:endonuclease/exonuclease/phosphatase family metal-dependent hydrolase
MRSIAAIVAVLLTALPAANATACSRHEAPPELSVLTFNIRYNNPADGEDAWPHRKAMAAAVIRDHAPDAVGLQEALHGQIDDLLAALPGYAIVGVGRDDGKQKGEYSAILYRADRLEVLDSGTFWLSETPEVPGSKSWATACTRVCTWARFQDRAEGGRTFYHFNTHMDHQSQDARLNGAKLILQRIRARATRDPVVITGDFNAGEDNPAVRLFTAPGALTGENTPAPFIDTFRAVHPDERNAGTFHAFQGAPGAKGSTRNKIDYILVSPGITARSAAIDTTSVKGRYPSDHFPVAATVALEDAAPAPQPSATPESPGSKK